MKMILKEKQEIHPDGYRDPLCCKCNCKLHLLRCCSSRKRHMQLLTLPLPPFIFVRKTLLMKKNKRTGRPIIPLPPEKDFSHLKDAKPNAGQLYVLEKLAKGYTYQQIGDSLGITARSAAKRIEKLHATLESQLNIQAYNRALLLGFLPLK